jgi:chemotaxis protein CheD
MSLTEIEPGSRYVATDTRMLFTLLGSCVSACLYDPVAKVCGMNHFLLANPRYSKTLPVTRTEAGRYGLLAMELLINDMLKAGATRTRLKAKVFGGGAVLTSLRRDNFACVGEVNARFVKEFLHTEQIPMEAEDLGGEEGRVIYFRTDTFQVYRRFIKNINAAILEQREHGLWKKQITQHEKQQGEVILFGK